MALVFISYTRGDAATAAAVARALGSAEVPFALDVEGIRPGDNFVDWISRTVETANYLILLVSQASMESEWVNREWTAALSGGVPVLPVVLDDTPVPAILRPLQYIDLRSDPAKGMARLLDFFVEEGRPIRVERMGGGGAAVGDAVRRNLTLQTVRRAALHCMDKADLQSALFEFNISENDIGGDALSERIVLLLAVLKRDRALDGFIEFMASENRLNRCLTRFFET